MFSPLGQQYRFTLRNGSVHYARVFSPSNLVLQMKAFNAFSAEPVKQQERPPNWPLSDAFCANHVSG